MDRNYRESLISFLSNHPSSRDEIEKLVGDNILSSEEAAVLNMRVAVQKLDKRIDSLLEKTEQEDHAGLKPCAAY
jgi:hypothetical protein